MMIDLVIFDCDGVLIDSEDISARQLVDELAKRGVDIDLAYVAQHFLGRSYPVVMKQIRDNFGIELTAEFEEQYRENLLAAFETDLRAIPGVGDVLNGLRRDFCVATSSSPARVRRSFEIVGFDQVFEGRVTTAVEVERGKPAPDLFLLAAAKRGVPPERCLVIEDSVTGVKAGLSAGMKVWRFTGGSHLCGLGDSAGAIGTFANFEELPHLVPEIFTAKDSHDVAP